jgi:ABC-type nitrate/sulfonate/bicarbonate transport system substrate-binding protein
MNAKLTVLVALLAVSLTGCAGFAFNGRSGMGALYADSKLNESVSGNAIGAKTGEACATSILGWVTTGDASTVTAAKNGGVKKVATVDNKSTNILGIYSTYCTVVTGD